MRPRSNMFNMRSAAENNHTVQEKKADIVIILWMLGNGKILSHKKLGENHWGHSSLQPSERISSIEALIIGF